MKKFIEILLGVISTICGAIIAYISLVLLFMGFWVAIILFISGIVSGVIGLIILEKIR